MEKGYSDLTKSMFRMLEPGLEEELDIFVGDALTQDYQELTSDEEVTELFGELSNSFTDSLTLEDSKYLRYYTGFSYKEINAILRDNWTYEQNGRLTEEKQRDYEKTGHEVEKIIFKFPPLGRNIKVYRGATLSQFRKYGISTLEDLVHMEGKYFYDGGFTSTSLVREKSLFKTEAFLVGKRKVEIEYLIPESCHDGALLLNDYTSSYQTEQEYVMNSGSLTRIISVEIDKENDTAHLKAVLIPKKIWDPNFIRYLEEETKRVTK